MSRPQISTSAIPEPEPSTSALPPRPLKGSPDTDISVVPRGASNPSPSTDSGYPSWLPRRPPPPGPASTVQSEMLPSRNGTPLDTRYPAAPVVGGRKPTPRSVRIMSVQDALGDTYGRHREPTDQTRVPSGPLGNASRAWSRGASSLLDRRMLEESAAQRPPRPRFRGPNLRLAYLRSTSILARLYFYMLPLFVFAHIPLQTFFDFNAVFVLIQVSKFPNPEAPGVAGDGRGWELATAAYVACWLIQMIGVCFMYEFIYSFYRRWRQKRPLILPIYLSSSALNFARMTDYDTFSFFAYLRVSAFLTEHGGSLRDGLAESCYFLAQNLPTVVLLLPRAAMCLALLLEFSSPVVGELVLADEGMEQRDGTFFRGDGSLTSYARGVMIANAAWTAWRAIVLIASWLGLWLLSEQGCGGLCGPRYRWEEEEGVYEKAYSIYSEGGEPFGDDTDRLIWSWRECTVQRLNTAYESCLISRIPHWRRSRRTGDLSDLPETTDVGTAGRNDDVGTGLDEEGVKRVLAAVGLPTSPPPARRGILTDDLFESPQDLEKVFDPTPPAELSEIIPPVTKPLAVLQTGGTGDPNAPLMALPYPFTGYPAQTSSVDRVHVQPVPFPPSPAPPDDGVEVEDEIEIDIEDDEEEEEYEEEVEDEEEYSGSGDPSSMGRTSESLSSLGQPVTSRYPFQFRTPPARRRGSRPSDPSSRGTVSTSSRSGHKSGSGSRHTPQSGYAASTSNQGSSSGSSPPISPSQAYLRAHARGGSLSGVMPMPPGGNGGGRKRTRAGTIPVASGQVEQVPEFEYATAEFQAGPSSRVRTESATTENSATFGPGPVPAYEGVSDDEEDRVDAGGVSEMGELAQVREEVLHEGDSIEGEREDSVGLLSHAPSPRSSLGALRHRARSGSRSGSGSRTNSQTSRSGSNSHPGSAAGSTSNLPLPSIRSRTQSLIHSISAASRSSAELAMRATGSGQPRSRANSSIARLSDSPYLSQSEMSNSGSERRTSSSGENYTFGQPFPLAALLSGQQPQPHPLRTEVQRQDSQDSQDIDRDVDTSTVPTIPDPQVQVREARMSLDAPDVPQDASPQAQDGAYLNVPVHGLRSSRSDLSAHPSQVSEPTITPVASTVALGSTPPDISTAGQSFVTVQSSISRHTDDTVTMSGGSVSSHGHPAHQAH